MIFDKTIKPKLFQEGIKTSVLEILANNRGQFFTVKQMKDKIMADRPFIYDFRCMLYLAFGGGLVGKITSSIHQLRIDGYPIVSSAEFGKGYCYINPNDYMSPDYWDSKFLANEKREDIPKTERKIDQVLFVQCLEKCDKPELRKRLVLVAQTHRIDIDALKQEKIEKEKKEGEEDEDE